MATQSIRSARQLAELLKLSHTAVNKWLADSRWKFGPAPWAMSQLPAIKRWQAANLAEDPAAGADADRGDPSKISLRDLSPDKQLKAARVLVQTQREKFKLEQEKGLFHRVDECERRRLRQIHAVKQELLTAPDAMPADTPPAIRDWVRQRMEQICHHFAGTAGTKTA